MRRFWQKIMTHLEMRSFEPHYDPDETEMSAQERLLYNNNYNSNHHHNHHLHNHHHHHHHHSNSHLPNNGSGDSGGSGNNSGTGSSASSNGHHHNNHNNMAPVAMTSLDEENHYQLPYAHLHQSPYMTSPLTHQLHQPPPPHLQHQPHGSYSSGDDHSSTYGGGPRPPPMNGHNGMGTLGTGSGIYPHPYAGTFGTLQEKYSVAYPVRGESDSMMGRRGNRHNGSGIVYRPRKRLWWAVMMLALVLLIIAGAVVIAVYFTVLQKDAEPAQVVDSSSESAGGPDSTATDVGTIDGAGGDSGTQEPTYKVPGGLTTPNPDSSGASGEMHGLSPTKVTKFDAFWHPGDSRLFKALLANGTVVEVFGPKKSDGTVKSIYSLILRNHGTGPDNTVSTHYIRFQGKRNIASVVLPNGVIVSYDWSVDPFNLEVKVYEPITQETTQGPISHLAKVDVGVSDYALQQIYSALSDLPDLTNVPISSGRSRPSGKCFSRFPVYVKKCNGRFPYGGAFVQGEISGFGPSIRMAALPWPEKSDDPCHQGSIEDTTLNYYLPLPGMVDDDNATMIKEAYVASSAKIFFKLCDVVNDDIYKERHNLCSDIAEKVRSKLGYNQLLDMVYSSCSIIFNALHTICAAVKDISENENLPALTEHGLLRSFHRRISDSFPATLPEQVDVKTHVFCPSSIPISSFDTSVSTRSIRGNVVQDAIHINCPDYPEVTSFALSHTLTKSDGRDFDQVTKQLRLCSMCSVGKDVSVQILEDTMYCNSTCSEKHSQEIITSTHIPETTMFTTQHDVACNTFLSSVTNKMKPAIGPTCVANCLSNIKVRFSIKDPDSKMPFYNQEVDCSELKHSSCSMRFGS